MLVPGGALDDNGRWATVRRRKTEFLVPVAALAKKFPYRTVTFRYRDSKNQQPRTTMTLPPEEFFRRFLQHVPPQGFHPVRSYGLPHSSQRVTLRRLQLMLQQRGQTDFVVSRQEPRSNFAK
jgi:hypothetical protein